ncbi:hypothetical protein ACM0CU_24100 [Mycobacteroides abscessus subsp. abscessus]|uniref:hypothetical protein n=1 Tax=Mycobacteroides abscessus TaxID=36809 RepID=UPI0039EEFA5C
MTAENDNPAVRRGDYDHLWVVGIVAALGYAAIRAAAHPAAEFAATRGLMWSDAEGWHAEPLAWLTLIAAVGAIGGAATWAGWAAAARRWRRSQLGAIPRPPAVAAGLIALGAVWLFALATIGTSAIVRGIAVSVAIAAGGAAWLWACRYRGRAVAAMVFASAATGQLGFAEPGLAKVQAGRWEGQVPAAIRATTGPGWRGASSDHAALDRAADAAGWPGPYRWRNVTAARAVVGELAR